MLQITEVAEKKIAALMTDNQNPVKGLRVEARAQSMFKVDYHLGFISQEQVSPEDTVVAFDGFEAYMDPESTPLLDKATIDYVEGPMGSGFKIDAPPTVPPHLEGTVAEKIEALIQEHINPALTGHGGYVSLVDIKDSVVYVELGGGCQGCARSRATLKEGIERVIKQAVPEITQVLDATDHASGQNPYY